MTATPAPAPLAEDELHRLLHLAYVDSFREMARWSGRDGTIEERDGLLFSACGSAFPVAFNTVQRLDPAVPAAEVIAAADAWFGARGRGWSTALRIDDPADAEFSEVAVAAGLLALGGSPEMVCRARLEDRPVPDGIELRWVTDAAGMADMVAVNDAAYTSLGMPAGQALAAVTDADAFTEPHVQTVVAYDGDTPVASALTTLSHGIAGVYWVGTAEGARGRGLGDTVARAVTNRAFDLGARAVGLQASSMGQSIYERMGYETLWHYATHLRFEALPEHRPRAD